MGRGSTLWEVGDSRKEMWGGVGSLNGKTVLYLLLNKAKNPKRMIRP